MDYFSSITLSATKEELAVLNTLYLSESLQGYQSIPRDIIQSETELSNATMRKVISNLERIQFIKKVSGSKKHMYYISPYGLSAIEMITKQEGIEC